MEKRVQDYTQEILDTIRSNSSPAVMGSRLEDYHENDLADVLPLLTVPERCKLYRILDTDMLSDIFEYAESDNVAEYLEEMDVKKAASILSKMETDAPVSYTHLFFCGTWMLLVLREQDLSILYAGRRERGSDPGRRVLTRT